MSRPTEGVTTIDGTPHLKLTRGRAAALRDALEAALDAGILDKRISGTVRSLARIVAQAADGHAIASDPSCRVYLAAHPSHPGLAKIGHARDVGRRFARATDSPVRLRIVATWTFPSVAEAMAQEERARGLLPAHAAPDANGGTEWVQASPENALAAVRRLLGPPDEATTPGP